MTSAAEIGKKKLLLRRGGLLAYHKRTATLFHSI
jgi:hypothetical protein